MPRKLLVGVIGDFQPTYDTHTMTNLAFRQSADRLGVVVEVEWLPTPSLDMDIDAKMGRFDAFLCAPGSPYKSPEGALNGIRYARENDRPFLGTCGGCQNAIIEYARNAMGMKDAEHAEEHPEGQNRFVTPLTCSMVGKIEKVKIIHGTRASKVYGAKSTMEKFYCNYGLNPSRRKDIEAAGLRVSGLDAGGEVRILELPKARFYFATLFVPQATSSAEHPHPMITGLLKAAQST
ncbi:TPA: CTP synthase [Candidatus Bathyarchaeota archaeon]|nr:CTP synthase [Candidatus Bathyarchaeota archaeon]